jgi:hypothetical protein
MMVVGERFFDSDVEGPEGIDEPAFHRSTAWETF